ncbi:(3S,6E)-nerolidol synthase 1-like isoform X2 [Punica granatum]|uniref:(3S,6E)-nerolidol synthase 1-like isoform X2 n=1 Tax=Punica granatum TaxID=22663 RepID=A0A6P8DSB4_PUNGR|nr:(3S,6E)-nerolidol synthase 1-like isoform X2 [Punica granatum]
MALFRAVFACPQQPIPTPRLSPPHIIRADYQECSMSRPIYYDKSRAALYDCIVSSPLGASHLPDGLHKITGGSEGLHRRRLKEVRHLLEKVEKGSLESLVMVDALQRLGIAYHFEEEIKSILHEHLLISTFDGYPGNISLYEASLRFRLLRQEGYFMPADIFEGFMTKEKSTVGYVFDLKLWKDIFGLMSMYEASHLGIQGEDILDEAADFSKRALILSVANDIKGTSSQILKELVSNTLSNPFHKSLPRFTSKSVQGYFAWPYEWTGAFGELAISDTNLVQSINQIEIRQISKWWSDLGLAKELKFARDQPMKWYMWPMAILPDPKLSQERQDLTKAIAMIYIIDDIFDVYGSLDELTLFAQAINRWECNEELPNYMKACFRALDDIINDVSFNVFEKHGWNPTDLIRKSWARLCDAFLVEARWFTSRHSPLADEYLKNAIVSSGVHIVMVHSFAFLSESVNQHSLEMMLNNFPGISSSTGEILRLWDDLGSAKDENQEGHDGSYLDYYMKENPSCSLKGARDHMKEMISDAWKSLNKEFLFPDPFSPSLVRISLNTARMVPLMYDYDENHHLQRIEEYMKSVLHV